MWHIFITIVSRVCPSNGVWLVIVLVGMVVVGEEEREGVVVVVGEVEWEEVQEGQGEELGVEALSQPLISLIYKDKYLLYFCCGVVCVCSL